MSYLVRLSLALMLIGCSQNSNLPLTQVEDANYLIQNNKVNNSYQLQILDDLGKPVVGAKILIGQELNQPFANNLFESDSSGQVTVSQLWRSPQSITIDGPGIVRTTYMNFSPSDHIFTVRKQPSSNTIATGITSGYTNLRKDKHIDFSLVLALMERKDMLQFDLSKILSPVNDTVTVVGRSMEVPSNLSIPKQKESYIIPVTIEKLPFRLPLATSDAQDIMAIHGRFKFKSVVNDIQDGKSIFDVVNKFDFLGGGIRNFKLNQQLDIPIAELSFPSQFSVKAPAIPSGYDMVAVTLNEKGNKYYPSDIKRIQSNQSQTLKAATANNVLILGVIAKEIKLGKKSTLAPGISISLNNTENMQTPSFLEIPAEPKIQGRQVQLSSPNTIAGVSPSGTYINLHTAENPISRFNSDLEIIASTNKQVKWEIYSNEWVQNLELPKFPGDPNQVASDTRLEVIYLGSEKMLYSKAIGPNSFEVATHAARNATSF